jgi:hypothetical protein
MVYGILHRKMTKSPIYKVIFQNNNNVYELFARAIYQSDMYGFIEVEEFVFGEPGQLLVNPGEEKLKNEFSDVIRSYIPMYAIIRIDEVEKEGAGKIIDGAASGNVHHFPMASGRPIKTPEGE